MILFEMSQFVNSFPDSLCKSVDFFRCVVCAQAHTNGTVSGVTRKTERLDDVAGFPLCAGGTAGNVDAAVREKIQHGFGLDAAGAAQMRTLLPMTSGSS